MLLRRLPVAPALYTWLVRPPHTQCVYVHLNPPALCYNKAHLYLLSELRHAGVSL